MIIERISSLPDYAALRKLASVLWQQDNSYHGAAIMVGAGFSRSAASTGNTNKKLPLWNSFSKRLAYELDSDTNDPLRLAEEYCAYFNKQALHDLIKKEINDAAWSHSELHTSLLELPWSEVLTTNWDTLLERASIEIHQPIYSIVTKPEDLSSAKSPRIVKLHGTIDITKDLIFTQEDYRKYPQQYAAFVNFSRQTFIENELCLLGFSGDDPNFLQWAGWVRDHLATHSRRIYLVGALGLNSAKRKYLESINVAPIDLDDLVKDYDEGDIRHLEATKIFIQTLQDLKPKKTWEWNLTQLYSITTSEEDTKIYQDANYAAKLLEQSLPALEKDRISYPDWLVCPYGHRKHLQCHMTNPWPNTSNLSAMEVASKDKLLYEIAWHRQVAFDSIPLWLEKELLAICDTNKACALSKKQQLEIALLLLKNTLWSNHPESQHIAQTTEKILENGKKYWPAICNELAYHKAIVARNQFDYNVSEQHAEKIITSDSIWKLRKASLLAELGQLDKGETLVTKAYKELQIQYRNDRNSIYVLSRLAWAHWIMRGVDLSSLSKEFKAFPSHYQDSKCDPWDHIEHIRDHISKALNGQQTIEPLFKPGHYKNNTNAVTINNEPYPWLLLEGISNTTGMPLRWGNVGFLAEQAARAAELEEINNLHRFTWAIRSASCDTSEVLKKVFSRVRVACFSEDDVTFLIKKCVSAVRYWEEKRKEKSTNVSGFALKRLQVFIEVLARISVRASPEQAKQLFLLAVSLGANPELQHLWLFDPLNHLLDFSLESIPESQQNNVLLDALSFPLQSEIKINYPKEWVNPVINQPGERKEDSALDRRIDEIIDHIAPCSSQSASALKRLIPLIDKNFLTERELGKIEQKVWGADPEPKSLPETGLLSYVLLKIPSPNPSIVQNIIRRYLFEAEPSYLITKELLMNILNAAKAEGIKEFPSADQAAYYFEKLVVWRPNINSDRMFGFFQNTDREIAELIGKVLAQSVVPVLLPEILTEENFKKLCDFHSETSVSEVLIALPYFAVANEIFIESVEKLIRQGLQANDTRKRACAAYSLLIWRNQEELPSISKLILRLVYIISANQVEDLPALLWTANQMYCKGYLSSDSVESLKEMLPIIFDNADYKIISWSDRKSVSVSLVRAACAKLARDMLNRGHQDDDLLRILDEAKKDPLPEVRFA